MNTFQKIYTVVSKIPKGKVATYKQIANLSGVKNPRYVGFALHANKDPKSIPCHRVVNVKGFVASAYAFGGARKQKSKLQNEGVIFKSDNQVDLERSLLEK